MIVYRQLIDVQKQLHKMTEDGQEDDCQRENLRPKQEWVTLESYREHLEGELQELRYPAYQKS